MVYLDRAELDNAEIEDLADRKGTQRKQKILENVPDSTSVSFSDDENLGHISCAWRLCDRIQNKTFLFAHRTPLDKIQMMDSLEYERAYVEENLAKGLEIPLYTRLATLTTRQYLNENQSTVKSLSSAAKQSTKK